MSATTATSARQIYGRDADLTAIAGAFEVSSFVLLLGPGGAGKTTLARAFAAREGAPDVSFFDLSSTTNAAGMVASLSAGLGLTVGAADLDAAIDQVRDALAARGDHLVILDNLENIAGVADVLRRLVRVGPRLLGTSRIKLGVVGEHDLEVGPLGEEDAVALFLDRARLVAPEVDGGADTLELVRRLEGSPLAIELAAARAHVLPPRALLGRVSRRLDVLKSSAPTLPARHRSLRAVVTGSWELCSELERRALAMSAVFRGSFDLEAAEAVLGLDAPDAIEALLGASLVHRAASAIGPRFALYDGVRELALEKLQADDALRDEAERKHAAYFHALVERFAERARNAEATAVEVIAADSENLLAAFRHSPRAALAHGAVFHRTLPADLHLAELERSRDRLAHDAVATAELEIAEAKAIRRFGKVARSVEQAQLALAAASACKRDLFLAEAHYMLGVTLYDAGRLAESRAQEEEAIRLAQACGAPATLARALDQLGFCALDEGDFALATRCADREIAIAREHGFRMLESFAENLHAGVYRRRGELGLAEKHLRRGVALMEEVMHPPQHMILLGNLGRVLLLAGDLGAATETLEEALALTRRWGQRKTEVAQLVNLATVVADAGELVDARARATHAEALSRDVQHRRITLQAALLLGTLALLERRASDATDDFGRARLVAEEIGSAPGRASALAGAAAARAMLDDLDGADTDLAHAGEALASLAEVDLAWVDTARALVEIERARCARRRGDVASATAAEGEAARLLAATLQRSSTSAEVRLLRRAAVGSPQAAPAAPAASPSPGVGGPFEVVGRTGTVRAEAIPSDADLAFDAIERTAVVDAKVRVDLRKKPILARLLEVALSFPNEALDKERLYREVWHAEFRSLSQGAAVYKAVDRLAHLLHEDSRRFLRWDEEGRLVLTARSPALLRSPTES